MKKIACIAAFLYSYNLYAQKPVNKTTVPPPASIKLNNASDTMQYTLGAYVALWINGNGFLMNNAPLFVKGMDDVFGNKPRLVPDSLIAPLVTLYQQLSQKDKASKLEQQLFAGIKDKPGLGIFPNGVRYVIVQPGKGPRPSDTDSIIVNLIARLPDGTVVEDTYLTKKPFAATTTSFFPGLNATLQEMPEGSKWTLYIPSVLAYGEKGTSAIPANSALIMDVELMEVKPRKKNN